MKKLMVILVSLLTISGVMASTIVDTTWSGSGIFETHFIAGDDAQADFWTGGSSIEGSFQATDSDNNPYGYGVDSVEAKVKAKATDGFIEYNFDRTDSKSSYGEAGQKSYTSMNNMIGTGGTSDFAWRSSSNYASLTNSNWGWQANGQMQATGNQEIIHTFGTATEWAGMHVVADATTYISDMAEKSTSTGYRFGWGDGCYTNAEVDIVGSGTFDLYAYADNSIVTDTGITTDGFLNIHSDFTNGFHYNNFALEGN